MYSRAELRGEPRTKHGIARLIVEYCGILLAVQSVLELIRHRVGGSFLFLETAILGAAAWLLWRKMKKHSAFGFCGHFTIGAISFICLAGGEILVASLHGISADLIIERFDTEQYQYLAFFVQLWVMMVPVTT